MRSILVDTKQTINFATKRRRRTTGCLQRGFKTTKSMLYCTYIGDSAMTRDRIVEVTKKGAQRVAKTEVGIPAKKKYVKRLAELKTKRAMTTHRAAGGERLRA